MVFLVCVFVAIDGFVWTALGLGSLFVGVATACFFVVAGPKDNVPFLFVAVEVDVALLAMAVVGEAILEGAVIGALLLETGLALLSIKRADVNSWIVTLVFFKIPHLTRSSRDSLGMSLQAA